LTCEHNPKPENEHGNGKQQVQLKAKLMIAPSITGSKDERLNKIISVMKNDCFSKIVQKDPLIKAFGSTMIGKKRTKRTGRSFLRE
jgi:predicted transcriptional regulator